MIPTVGRPKGRPGVDQVDMQWIEKTDCLHRHPIAVDLSRRRHAALGHQSERPEPRGRVQVRVPSDGSLRLPATSLQAGDQAFDDHSHSMILQ